MKNILEHNNKKSIAFYTLGCKLNFAETSMISRKFWERGYKKTDFNSNADIIIINTCSVTQVADKKCRQIISKAKSTGAKIVVMGCYSQLKPAEIASIKGVDLVLGTKEKFDVLEHVEKLLNGYNEKIISCNINEIESFDPSYSIADRTRAFLKIQDGCDYYCSYCTVPLARGKSRNGSIASIVLQAELIVANGIKEIVLTGVNIADFGRSTGEKFFNLLSELEKIDDIGRYRISSIEPNLIDDEIIDLISRSSKFAHHFHIPLQSGCNKILKSMNRRYTRKLYAEKINKIRNLMPFACIGTDVITGFPGETDDNFNNTLSFINSLDINYLHVFPYSERPGTKAALLDNKIHPGVKSQRIQLLRELSDLKKEKFYRKNQSRYEKVIFESLKKGQLMHGFTSNYIKVEALYKREHIGIIKDVLLENISSNGNYTTIINQ